MDDQTAKKAAAKKAAMRKSIQEMRNKAKKEAKRTLKDDTDEPVLPPPPSHPEEALPPPPPTASSPPPPEEDNNWECPSCQYLNTRAGTKCIMCNKQKPGQNEIGWKCPKCQHENFATAKSCSMCEHKFKKENKVIENITVSEIHKELKEQLLTEKVQMKSIQDEDETKAAFVRVDYLSIFYKGWVDIESQNLNRRLFLVFTTSELRLYTRSNIQYDKPDYQFCLEGANAQKVKGVKEHNDFLELHFPNCKNMPSKRMNIYPEMTAYTTLLLAIFLNRTTEKKYIDKCQECNQRPDQRIIAHLRQNPLERQATSLDISNIAMTAAYDYILSFLLTPHPETHPYYPRRPIRDLHINNIEWSDPKHTKQFMKNIEKWYLERIDLSNNTDIKILAQFLKALKLVEPLKEIVLNNCDLKDLGLNELSPMIYTFCAIKTKRQNWATISEFSFENNNLTLDGIRTFFAEAKKEKNVVLEILSLKKNGLEKHRTEIRKAINNAGWKVHSLLLD